MVNLGICSKGRETVWYSVMRSSELQCVFDDYSLRHGNGKFEYSIKEAVFYGDATPGELGLVDFDVIHCVMVAERSVLESLDDMVELFQFLDYRSLGLVETVSRGLMRHSRRITVSACFEAYKDAKSAEMLNIPLGAHYLYGRSKPYRRLRIREEAEISGARSREACSRRVILFVQVLDHEKRPLIQQTLPYASLGLDGKEAENVRGIPVTAPHAFTGLRVRTDYDVSGRGRDMDKFVRAPYHHSTQFEGDWYDTWKGFALAKWHARRAAAAACLPTSRLSVLVHAYHDNSYACLLDQRLTLESYQTTEDDEMWNLCGPEPVFGINSVGLRASGTPLKGSLKVAVAFGCAVQDDEKAAEDLIPTTVSIDRLWLSLKSYRRRRRSSSSSSSLFFSDAVSIFHSHTHRDSLHLLTGCPGLWHPSHSTVEDCSDSSSGSSFSSPSSSSSSSSYSSDSENDFSLDDDGTLEEDGDASTVLSPTTSGFSEDDEFDL